MPTIPASVQSDVVQRKVRVGNLLTGMLIAVAIVINHSRIQSVNKDM